MLHNFERLSIQDSQCIKQSLLDEINKTTIQRQQRHFVEVTFETKISINAQPEKSQRMKQKSRMSFSQIGGLDPQIQMIQEMMNLTFDTDKHLLSANIPTPKGLLVYGPSGCGKTMLIKTIAQESGFFTVTINGPEIWSKYYGESESKLVSFFKLAKQRYSFILLLLTLIYINCVI